MIEAEAMYLENEKLIYQAIYSHFKSHHFAERVANQYNMDFDDFVQIGAMALWKACNKYQDEGEASFAHYAITWIKSSIMTEIKRRGYLIRYPEQKLKDIKKYEFDSLDREAFEDGQKRMVKEIIPSNLSVEKQVIRKIEFYEKLRKVNDRQQKIILMRLSGASEQEIATSLNITLKAVQASLQRALKKISPQREKRVNLAKDFNKLYEQGKTKEEIMSKLNINAAAYRNYKYRYNKGRVTA